jgi:hypothetical protein
MEALSPLAPTRTHQGTTRSNKNKKWSVSEDATLTALVTSQDEVDWQVVAARFPDKTHQQVVEHWTKVLDPTLMKGSWTRAEDQTIVEFVESHGTKSWSHLTTILPGRIGKQCRERWVNHLNPEICHEPFTPEDDRRIMELHRTHGNKWARIADLMRSRSCNAIKNRWNSVLAKRADMEMAQGEAEGKETK